ncbi:cytochrome c peroxidase [Chitinophaga dinghuensis]|uniref:Cytochrome c peroxidase n=1 Tax=Chitinophaga dinghuensis TaxID=1539050 RepID=A0A327W0C4_9BACT|nr:cytochrome c peroxidase [Chitinophaga dinghuensis]RAJ82212.1 cytochrome c peroxidase [Chitinophaga dinghuensis]
MKRTIFILSGLLLIVVTSALNNGNGAAQQEADSLRALYARPVAFWPRPDIDSGAVWQEFAPILPDTMLPQLLEQPQIKLGKTLFFDPRLSGSNQISCSSCHDPDLAWGDGRTVSLGHDHLQGSRNTPSLLNAGVAHKTFFWDGRSASLADQAVNPIATHHEMNMEPALLSEKLGKITGYRKLFQAAYGSEQISIDRIVQALAAFEGTIKSRTSRFDLFLMGNYRRLTDEEIQGLHLFRTKARCMNCHNGQYFTDDAFHNIGLTYYKRKYEDLGRYRITGNAADVGKFRTPSLRDVMLTRPWMHNGLFDNIEGVINIYNSGMQMMKPRPGQEGDSLFPRTDPLMKELHLSPEEKKAVVAFLNAITGVPYKMRRPELPQ